MPSVSFDAAVDARDREWIGIARATLRTQVLDKMAQEIKPDRVTRIRLRETESAPSKPHWRPSVELKCELEWEESSDAWNQLARQAKEIIAAEDRKIIKRMRKALDVSASNRKASPLRKIGAVELLRMMVELGPEGSWTPAAK